MGTKISEGVLQGLDREEAAAEKHLALTRRQLVDVLFRLHACDSADKKSRVENRFKSLQKVDLPSGKRPTKGQRGSYTLSQICETVLCFEFAKQFGLDAWFVKKHFYSNEHYMLWPEAVRQVIIASIQPPGTELPKVTASFKVDYISLWAGEGVILEIYPLSSEISDQRGISSLNLTLIALDMMWAYPKQLIEHFRSGM